MHAQVTADQDTYAGQFVIVGDEAGYATHAAAAGESLRIQTSGRFVETVLSSEDVLRGQPIFFEDGYFSAISGTIVGIAYEDAVSESDTARVIIEIGDPE